jgi:hypothetical protein
MDAAEDELPVQKRKAPGPTRTRVAGTVRRAGTGQYPGFRQWLAVEGKYR